MTRVLLLGSGPLPEDLPRVVDFPRLRTWQFLRGMLEAGFEIALVASVPDAEDRRGVSDWRTATFEGHPFQLLTVSPEIFDRPELPDRWRQEIKPDAVVSAGPFAPARAAARIGPGTPVLIDLPGDIMAEAQLRAASSGDVSHLEHGYRVLSAALARGDAFTVVSGRQRAAVLGQLGMAGRLTPEAVGREVVLTVPVGLEPAWQRWAEASSPTGRLPNRILWPGAINTWADLRTFFEACTRALELRPDLEVVVTGGPIAGHEEEAWRRLETWVRASPQRERWRLTGWIDPVAAAREVCEARVGVSLDLPCSEAWLGSRTRLLYGLALGLPWITTPGCELADQLIEVGWARAVPHGDPEAVCRALLEAVGPEGSGGAVRPVEGAGEGSGKPGAPACAASSSSLRAQLLDAHRNAAIMAPVLRWLASPQPMPTGIDLQQGLSGRVAELERALSEVHHSLTWRVLGALHRRLRRFITPL